MRKRLVSLVLVFVLLLGASGCYSLTHTVGSGPQTGVKLSERQWYILWGLVPLGTKDSATLAGNAADYRVTTKYSVTDIILNIFTGLVTIHSRTISVQK
jgi:hypothetical protein